MGGKRLQLGKGVVGHYGRWAEFEPSRHMVGNRGMAIEPVLWMKFWTLKEAKMFLAKAKAEESDPHVSHFFKHRHKLSCSQAFMLSFRRDRWLADCGKVFLPNTPWGTWWWLWPLISVLLWWLETLIYDWMPPPVQGVLYNLSPEGEDLVHYRKLEQTIVQSTSGYEPCPEDLISEDLFEFPLKSYHGPEKWAPVYRPCQASRHCRDVALVCLLYNFERALQHRSVPKASLRSLAIRTHSFGRFLVFEMHVLCTRS